MSEIRIIGVNDKPFPLEANFIMTVDRSHTDDWTRILLINGREYYTAEPMKEVQRRVDIAKTVSIEQPKKAKEPKQAKILKVKPEKEKTK